MFGQLLILKLVEVGENNYKKYSGISRSENKFFVFYLFIFLQEEKMIFEV
jgi:hypothetical protein